jgi:hypothetical protein
VIDGHTTLGQYLLKITIGHGITDVEKHGVDDHGFWIMCAFEINGHEGFHACSFFAKAIPRSGQYANHPSNLATEPFGIAIL